MSDSGFSLSKDDTTWAVVAHGFTFLEGGILAPLILYVLKKDNSPFVAFHALQSFYFGVLFVIVSVASCFLLLIPAMLFYFVFEFIACTRAAAGEWYRLPVVGDMALRAVRP